MPYYSNELVEEVRSRNNIVDVIGSYVKLTRKGNSYFGLCPFHGEKTPSFSVSENKQMYYCFGCGAAGDVFTFLKEYENLSFSEAMEVLASRSGVSLPKQEMSAEQKKAADRRSRLLEANKEAARYFYSLLHSKRGERAFKYFKGRQLTDETMQKFGLGYADQYSDDLYRFLRSRGYEDDLLKDTGLVSFTESHGGRDKFWNRAMFPIMDARSRVIAFGGRVMGEGEPKYLNSPETPIFDKSHTLYGLHIARATRRPQLSLCEGYMDVIALHQAGFDNAVASLGTSLTDGHASILKHYTNEVFLSYDSDGAGQRAALRAIPILKRSGLTARIINMQPYKDPDEFIKALGAEEYEKRMESAENSFMFEVRIMERQHHMDDPESKTAFFAQVADRLLEFDQELERNNYIEAVASRYNVEPNQLRHMVNSAAMKKTGTRQADPPRSGIQKRQKKEDGVTQSQKLLLTWLSEDVGLFTKLKGLITPEDFTEGVCRQAAEELFAQYEKDGTVSPAKLLDNIDDEELRREVVGIFHAVIPLPQEPEQRDKAFVDTVIRIKEASLKRRGSKMNPADMAAVTKHIEEKKALQALKKRGTL
ncbi:MAG: DNA primase [Clostridiales bacterium]|nr:DNA primase [Clostridiales bacterium]